jgi:hypothetical protein
MAEDFCGFKTRFLSQKRLFAYLQQGIVSQPYGGFVLIAD